MLDSKLAVIGPTVGRWLAIARRCTQCAGSRPGGVADCRGFGPACPAVRGVTGAETKDRIPYIPA